MNPILSNLSVVRTIDGSGKENVMNMKENVRSMSSTNDLVEGFGSIKLGGSTEDTLKPSKITLKQSAKILKPASGTDAAVLVQKTFRGFQGREQAEQAREFLVYALSDLPIFAGDELSLRIIARFRGIAEQADALMENLREPFCGTLADAVKIASKIYFATVLQSR